MPDLAAFRDHEWLAYVLPGTLVAAALFAASAYFFDIQLADVLARYNDLGVVTAFLALSYLFGHACQTAAAHAASMFDALEHARAAVRGYLLHLCRQVSGGPRGQAGSGSLDQEGQEDTIQSLLRPGSSGLTGITRARLHVAIQARFGIDLHDDPGPISKEWMDRSIESYLSCRSLNERSTAAAQSQRQLSLWSLYMAVLGATFLVPVMLLPVAADAWWRGGSAWPPISSAWFWTTTGATVLCLLLVGPVVNRRRRDFWYRHVLLTFLEFAAADPGNPPKAGRLEPLRPQGPEN